MTEKESKIALTVETGGAFSNEEQSVSFDDDAGKNSGLDWSKLQQGEEGQEGLQYTIASNRLTRHDGKLHVVHRKIHNLSKVSRDRMNHPAPTSGSVTEESLHETPEDHGEDMVVTEVEPQVDEGSTPESVPSENVEDEQTTPPSHLGNVRDPTATDEACDNNHLPNRTQHLSLQEIRARHQPGAFHGGFHSLDGLNARDVFFDEETTLYSDVPDDPIIEEVSAIMVDVEEENRKKREQVDKEVREALERKSLEERERIEVAEVVTGFWCTPRAKKLSILGIVLLVIIITVLAVTTTTTPASPPASRDPIDLLSSVALDGGETILTPLTPQNEAYKWLKDDANIGLYSDEKIIQRYALATLYFSTNGASWIRNDGWLRESDECTWFSTAEDAVCSNGRVMRLDLRENNLVGTIPQDIALFASSLEEMHISDNELAGTIPREVRFLTNLKGLDVGGNKFTGLIPTEMKLLTKLISLGLYSNELTGTIPSEISSATHLNGLYLYTNELTGKIPTELGLLTALEALYLYGNGLTGTIPTEIALVTTLAWLRMSECALSGTIPTEIALMTNLNRLWLRNNELNGTIPTEIAMMKNLQWLRLSNNSLTGTILSGIDQMTSLEWLWLRDNALTGTIPTGIARMTNLVWMFLGGNELTGTIPSEIAVMTNLDRLYLDNNELMGTIPTELALMTDLEWLFLYGNDFSGEFTCPSFIQECLISCEDVAKDECRSV